VAEVVNTPARSSTNSCTYTVGLHHHHRQYHYHHHLFLDNITFSFRYPETAVREMCSAFKNTQYSEMRENN